MNGGYREIDITMSTKMLYKPKGRAVHTQTYAQIMFESHTHIVSHMPTRTHVCTHTTFTWSGSFHSRKSSLEFRYNQVQIQANKGCLSCFYTSMSVLIQAFNFNLADINHLPRSNTSPRPVRYLVHQYSLPWRSHLSVTSSARRPPSIAQNQFSLSYLAYYI